MMLNGACLWYNFVCILFAYSTCVFSFVPFSDAFALSVCGGKDARTIISYHSVVKAGQSSFLLLPAWN